MAEETQGQRPANAFGLGCLGILIVILLLSFMGGGSNSGAEPSLESEDRDIRVEGLWRLEQGLREPDSMETRNVRVARPGIGGEPILCGEVNARNGFGGMTGYQRFMVVANVPMTEMAVGEGFDSIWRDAGC